LINSGKKKKNLIKQNLPFLR